MATNRLTTISYIVIASAIALTGWLHMGTLLITLLFSYFALRKMQHGPNKWISIALFLVLVAVVVYGFSFFIKQAVHATPKILNKSVPAMVQFANEHHFELPFSDTRQHQRAPKLVGGLEKKCLTGCAESTLRETVWPSRSSWA